MEVRFLHTRTVEGEGGETFHQGQVYDLAEASALRWIRRGVATAVAAVATPEPPGEAPAADALKPRRRQR